MQHDARRFNRRAVGDAEWSTRHQPWSAVPRGVLRTSTLHYPDIPMQKPDAVGSGEHRDAGSTFIEILVTIVLLGTVVIAVLTAVQTSMRVSTVNKDAARVETALLDAVDRVNRADRSSFPCDLSGPVVAAVEVQGWPSGTAAVEQWYLDSGVWTHGSAELPACPEVGLTQGLVQRVMVTVTSPDGDISRSIQVVKSDA